MCFVPSSNFLGEFEDKTNHFGAHYQISMIQTGPESFGHISELWELSPNCKCHEEFGRISLIFRYNSILWKIFVSNICAYHVLHNQIIFSRLVGHFHWKTLVYRIYIEGWSNNNKMVSTVLYNQIKLSRTRTRNEINKKISRISRDEMEGVFNWFCYQQASIDNVSRGVE